MSDDKDKLGRFRKGWRGGPGRPQRNFSIAYAMSLAADELTTADDGETMTRAQWAARWLWGVVTTGQDRSKEIPFKERLTALQTILNRIEPECKFKVEDMADDDASEIAEKLDNLTDDELQVLEKMGMRR